MRLVGYKGIMQYIVSAISTNICAYLQPMSFEQCFVYINLLGLSRV